MPFTFSEWCETRGFFIAIASQLCFRIRHQEGHRKQRGTHQLLFFADNLLVKNLYELHMLIRI
jgi:hypothetical protein